MIHLLPITEVLHRAPAAHENIGGPRQFLYLAEVDILGWKFRVMADGGFQIDLPYLEDGGTPMTSLTPAHARLIAALLALAEPQPSTLTQFDPATSEGVGSTA